LRRGENILIIYSLSNASNLRFIDLMLKTFHKLTKGQKVGKELLSILLSSTRS
jgi:hypothetical protein